MNRRPRFLILLVAALLAGLPPVTGRAQVSSLPITLEPVGFAPISDGLRQIEVYGEYAYVQGDGGLQIYSIATPATPHFMSRLNELSVILDMLIVDSYLYLATSRHTVRVYSLADPANPQPIGRYRFDGEAIALGATPGYLYVAFGVAGVAIYSFADPAYPALIGTFNWWREPPTTWVAWDVAVFGQRLFVTTLGDPWGSSRRLTLGDISDPAVPRPIPQREVVLDSSVLLEADSRHAYVANQNGTLDVFDLRDPQVMPRVGGVKTGVSVIAAKRAGPYLYAAGAGGITAIDTSVPTAPVVAGSELSPRGATDLVARGRYLYVASATGLHILTNGLDLSRRHYLPAVSVPGADS